MFFYSILVLRQKKVGVFFYNYGRVACYVFVLVFFHESSQYQDKGDINFYFMDPQRRPQLGFKIKVCLVPNLFKI